MTQRILLVGVALTIAAMLSAVPVLSQRRSAGFEIQEATIGQIQQAILTKQITTRGIVEAYLKRIQAYNGTCVNEPQGILGPITTKAHARQRENRCAAGPAGASGAAFNRPAQSSQNATGGGGTNASCARREEDRAAHGALG